MRHEYKRKFTIRYYLLLSAYLTDLSVKMYLLWKVGGMFIAFLGSVVDFGAKWYQLKHMKMRR